MATRYNAFLSYSHAADGRLAPSLQTGLQQFTKPWYRFKALNVFRDQTNLSINPSLWSSITSALDQAEFFILLASPEAATSKWVTREVAHWNNKENAKPVLLVLTDGNLQWDSDRPGFNKEKSNALPEILLEAYREQPLFLDLRWAKNSEQLSLSHPRFRDAIAKISATLHDKPVDELIGEEIRQHRRTRRLAWSAAALLATLTIFSAGTAWFANERRIEAELQNRISTARRLAAESNVLRSENSTELDLSVLLAIESQRLHQTPEAERALRSGLKLLPQPIEELQHAKAVWALAFSPDGKQLVTGSDDGTAAVFDPGGADPPVWLRHEEHPNTIKGQPSGGLNWKAAGYGAEVRAVAYSADGRWLATGNQDGFARIWDTNTYTERARFQHEGGVDTLMFHPHKNLLATGSKDGSARLWDLDSGAEILRVDHKERVTQVAFSRNGRYLAAISTIGPINLWDLENGNKHERWFSGGGLGLAFSDDNAHLATINYDLVTVWSTKDQKLLMSFVHSDLTNDFKTAGGVYLRDVEFSPDGAFLATAGDDDTARVWDLETKQEVVRLPHGAGVSAVAFSPDGQTLLSGSLDGTARLWELPHGNEILRQTHNQMVDSVAFHPDGKVLVSGDNGGNVKIWGRRPGDETARMPHADGVEIVRYSPDGKIIVTVDTYGKIQFWTDEGKAIGDPIKSPVWKPDTAMFSYDGRKLVLRHSNTSVILDISNPDDVMTLTDSSNYRKYGFRPDDIMDASISERYIVASTRDGKIRVFNSTDGEELNTVTDVAELKKPRLRHADYMLALRSDGGVIAWHLPSAQKLFEQKLFEFTSYSLETPSMDISPNGQLFAVEVMDAIEIWSVADKQRQWRIPIGDEVRSVRFFRDEKQVMVRTYSDVHIYDVRTGKRQALLQHQGEIRSNLLRGTATVANSSNHAIATLSKGRVRIWDTRTGLELARIGNGEIIDMRFSPNGEFLLTGNKDNDATIWLWRNHDLIKSACDRLERNLTEEEWNRFLSPIPKHPTCDNLVEESVGSGVDRSAAP